MSDEADVIYAPDGDLILMSSDGVAFKVSSHVLKAQSSVFAGMLAFPRTADETPATLDEPYGNRTDLKLVLNFSMMSRVPIGADLKYAPNLVDWLLRYDMEAIGRIKAQDVC